MRKFIHYIPLDDALVKVHSKIFYHKMEMEKANTFSRANPKARISWHGHQQRVEALTLTLKKLQAGEPCNRAIAQLFGKGTRIAQLDLKFQKELNKVLSSNT